SGRLSALPRHAIPLGEMLDYSALYRWRAAEESGRVEPSYHPINLEAALDRTFACRDAQPIPIVGEDGEPLDWVRSNAHRAIVESVLPEKYKAPFKEAAEWFADKPDEDTSMFSKPYQQPSEFNY